MTSLISLAAKECHVPEDWVRQTLRKGASRVALVKVPKRGGGKYRVVSHPSSELEILQRWLLIRFFEKLEIHEMAMAFRKGRSIVTNANVHRYSKYFVRIDFKDFFPSIKLSDFLNEMAKSDIGKKILHDYSDGELFIERICFDMNLNLPIGYVTSPTISNFVMFGFDTKLEELVATKKTEFGQSIVTRYADDIVFSTDKKGGCQNFLDEFSKLVANITVPRLQINSNKTHFTSRHAGSAIVTGLRVCPDSHITVTRKQKDAVRLLLGLYAKGILKSEDLPVLRGHLAYVRNAAPAFFSKLCLKFVNVIGDLVGEMGK